MDQDCDGNANTTPFQFSRATFSGLGQHRVTATDSAFVLLAAVTGNYDNGASAPGAQVAAVTFPLDAGPSTPPTFDSSPFPPGTGDLTAAVGAFGDVGRYYASLAWNTSSTTRNRTQSMKPTTSGSARYELETSRDGNSISVKTSHAEGELVVDTGTSRLWTVACDGARIQYTETSRSSALTRFASNFENLDAADCFVLPSTATGTLLINTVRPSGAIRSFTVGSGGLLTEMPTTPFTGYSVFHATNHDDWVVFGMRPSGVRLYRNASTVRNVLAGVATDHADAAFAGSNAYVVAVQPSGGSANLWLSFGNPTGSMTQLQLPFSRDGRAIVPERVAVEVAGGRVLIAVSGVDGTGTEQLGWALFEI